MGETNIIRGRHRSRRLSRFQISEMGVTSGGRAGIIAVIASWTPRKGVTIFPAWKPTLRPLKAISPNSLQLPPTPHHLCLALFAASVDQCWAERREKATMSISIETGRVPPPQSFLQSIANLVSLPLSALVATHQLAVISGGQDSKACSSRGLQDLSPSQDSGWLPGQYLP